VELANLQRKEWKLIMEYLKLKAEGASVTSKPPKDISEFCLRDGVLFRTNYEEFGRLWRIVLPHSLRKSVIRSVHEDSLSHLGIVKTWHMIRSRFFWKRMYKDIVKFVLSCHTCQIFNTANVPTPANDLPKEIPPKPFQSVSCDFMGPFPITARRQSQILLVICLQTRYVEAWPTYAADAPSAIKVFQKHILWRHGFPSVLVADRGTHFTSGPFQDFLRANGIEFSPSTPNHHQSVGVCERQNGTVKRTFAKLIQENQKDWDIQLPRAVFSVNCSVHKDFNLSPYFLVFGRDPQVRTDQLFPIIQDYLAPLTPLEVELRAEDANLHANRCTRIAQKRRYEEHGATHKRIIYSPGDLVMRKVYLTKKGLARKLTRKYEGPYTVVDMVGAANVRISKGTPPVEKLVAIANVKRYNAREATSDSSDCEPDSLSEDEMTPSLPRLIPQNLGPVIPQPITDSDAPPPPLSAHAVTPQTNEIEPTPPPPFNLAEYDVVQPNEFSQETLQPVANVVPSQNGPFPVLQPSVSHQTRYDLRARPRRNYKF